MIDITRLTPTEFALWCAGYLSGLVEGLERGRQQADAEAAALHHRAFAVVHAMARIEPRDAAADTERAARRADWWAERRGERRPA